MDIRVFDILPAQPNKALGWQVDYSFLSAVYADLEETSEERVSLEAIEDVLLTGIGLLIEVYFPNGFRPTKNEFS